MVPIGDENASRTGLMRSCLLIEIDMVPIGDENAVELVVVHCRRFSLR